MTGSCLVALLVLALWQLHPSRATPTRLSLLRLTGALPWPVGACLARIGRAAIGPGHAGGGLRNSQIQPSGGLRDSQLEVSTGTERWWGRGVRGERGTGGRHERREAKDNEKDAMYHQKDDNHLLVHSLPL